jgi:hypothetical protein
MHDRHEILKDADVWLRLEFWLSAWFRENRVHGFLGCWCDGFVPEAARDTRLGIEISGGVWLVNEPHWERRFSFVATVPQRMLHRRRDDCVMTDIVLDEAHSRLTFTLAPGAEA